MNKLLTRYFLLPGILLISAWVPKADMVSDIENLLQWEEKFGFKGAVCVVKDGRIIINKGYGTSGKTPINPQMLFYVASVSKPITALGVMKLVERKLISLDDPISRFFPSVPEEKKAITVKMLLTHTSGMKQTYSCDDIADRNQAVKTILEGTPMAAAVGTRYNYSGDNYSLLAAIIEVVTKQTFEDYLKQAILEPAGITHPSFTGTLTSIKESDIAQPWEKSRRKSLKQIEPTWGNKGRAGMILSVEDLYKIDKAFMEGDLFDSTMRADILSPKIAKATGGNYGYGFNLGFNMAGTKMFGHNGDDDEIGHNFEFIDFPEDNIKIFVASNSGLYAGGSWSTVISSLLQRFMLNSNYTYARKKLPSEKSKIIDATEELDNLEGVYRDASGQGNYHVWIHERHLIVSPVEQTVSVLSGQDKFYSDKDQVTKEILEEASRSEYHTLKTHTKDEEHFKAVSGTTSRIFKSLIDKNGPVEKIQVLGTANIWGGQDQAEVATWFRLVFKNTVAKYRLEWNSDGKTVGYGGNRVPYPMMFMLRSIGESEFVGFDAPNGRAITVKFSKSDGDSTTMTIKTHKETLTTINIGSRDVLPKRSAALLVYQAMQTAGVEAAFEKVELLKKRTDRFYLEEGELNDYGYEFLNRQKFSEAIAMFTIIVQQFPDLSNGYDSLGEAYLKSGDREKAVENYAKALALDPQNKTAKEVIEKYGKP